MSWVFVKQQLQSLHVKKCGGEGLGFLAESCEPIAESKLALRLDYSIMLNASGSEVVISRPYFL
jgi:hypothetical protein